MRQAQLPEWAKEIKPGFIEIDAEGFYPDWLQRINNWKKEPQEMSAKLLETAKQCAVMEIRHIIAGTSSMPESGGAIRIIVKDDTKSETGVSKWAQSQYSDANEVADKGVPEVRNIFKAVMQL